MYASKNYIEKPINLLSFDSLGHAILSEQAIDYIRSIPKPVSILSIAGPYRTGKSYLLNSIISADDSFQVSSTTSSCTKGLWIWGKPLLSVNEQGKITNVLVIDSQGFGSCQQVHDKRIIILALLLSTCFIYNSKGMIDKDSLKDLQYVIEQTKKVKRQICFDSVTDFHWVLRDFHFQLVNELGLEITPDQYMQKCFKQYSDQGVDQKQTFKLLNHFFRNRSCHTFVAPQTDPSQQQTPQFLQQLIKFKKVLSGIPSLDLDGEMLSQIIDAYVSAMNQNLAPTGVYQEGAQCRLRLNCLTQLCRQLQIISQQQQIQKRTKLLKAVLHQVEGTFISKMTSEKQIKMLKEQISMLVTQFDQSTAPHTTKNIRSKQKQREPRNSIYLSRPREFRLSTQQQQFISQKQIRSTNKVELMAAQKIRQQLQAKIHRHQLQNKDLMEQLKHITVQNAKIVQQKMQIQQKYNKLNDQVMLKQKNNLLIRMSLQQNVQNVKKQKMVMCSQLQKENELLKQKIVYLQQKIADIEIHSLQSASGITNRYKQQIAQLQKQNKQMSQKHNKDIQQLKQIYKQLNTTQSNTQLNRLDMDRSRAINEQLKIYIQNVYRLQKQNEQLMVQKTQIQNKYIQLQHRYKYEIQKYSRQEQKQNNIKNMKQIQKYIQKYTNIVQTKQKYIKQLQFKYEQYKCIKNKQIQQLVNNNNRQNRQLEQTIQQLQQQIRILKQECVQACEKLQIQQSMRASKQKQIELLGSQLDVVRQQQATHMQQYYVSLNQLRTQIDRLNMGVENKRKENEQLREQAQQLRKQMQREKELHQQHMDERKKLNQIQNNRYQHKILSLTHANHSIKSLQQQYQQLQLMYHTAQNQKAQIATQNQKYTIIITNMQIQCATLKQQNNKLDKIIIDLTNQIAHSQTQYQQFTNRNYSILQSKQHKYLQLIQKVHEKQKQCYLLTQQLQSIQKQRQSKQKQLRKLYNDKIQQQNNQIHSLNKITQNYNIQLKEIDEQLNRIKQQLCLSKQKCEFIQQNYSSQLRDAKDRSNRDSQRHAMEINQLQLQLHKTIQQKMNMSKTIIMHQNNTRQTCNNISDMRNRYDKNCQQYQANMKLMRKKIYQLESQNKTIKYKFDHINRQLANTQKCKNLLQENYNQDFKLWVSKIDTYQTRTKRMSN